MVHGGLVVRFCVFAVLVVLSSLGLSFLLLGDGLLRQVLAFSLASLILVVIHGIAVVLLVPLVLISVLICLGLFTLFSLAILGDWCIFLGLILTGHGVVLLLALLGLVHFLLRLLVVFKGLIFISDVCVVIGLCAVIGSRGDFFFNLVTEGFRVFRSLFLLLDGLLLLLDSLLEGTLGEWLAVAVLCWFLRGRHLRDVSDELR